MLAVCILSFHDKPVSDGQILFSETDFPTYN